MTLSQQRILATEIPGPRSQALQARKLATVSAGVGTTLPIYVEQAGGGIVRDVDGSVAAIREHGPRAEAYLRTSGDALRVRLADFTERLPNRSITLGSVGELPEGYEAAHILGLTYALDDLGDERRLRADLAAGVAAYRALKGRGGLERGEATEGLSIA